MVKVLSYNIIRFFVLVALQVFLFKNMGYHNLATPFPYLLFILLLPVGIPNFVLYGLAFLIGLTIDAFSDSLGVNAAACVSLARGCFIFIRIMLQCHHNELYIKLLLATVVFRWNYLK